MKRQLNKLFSKKIYGEIFAIQSQVLNPLRPAEKQHQMYYEGVQANVPFHKQ